jgi:hypothetical protein
MHSIMVNKEICLGEGASWILDINSPAAIFTLKSAAIRSTFAVQQRCCDALAGRFLPRLKAAPMSGFFFLLSPLIQCFDIASMPCRSLGPALFIAQAFV